MDASDPRATVAICTPPHAATLVGMPVSTLYTWLKPWRSRPPLVHRVEPEVRGWPSIPLIGLAEATVLRELRDGGMKMPEIVAAVQYLRERGGPYALGSPDLLHDGAVALKKDSEGIVALRTGQPLLPGVVEGYLHPFRLAPDGFVEAMTVRAPESEDRLPDVEIDPRFSSGRMRFTRTGVPLFAIAGSLEAGEPPDLVALEYGLTRGEVDLVQQHLPWLSSAA